MRRSLLLASAIALALACSPTATKRLNGRGGGGGAGAGGGGTGGTAGTGGTGGTDCGVRYDDRIYDPGSLLPPVKAGSRVTDPTFCTTFVRITTAELNTCRTPPWGQRAMSKGSRWIMIECDPDGHGFTPLLVGLDPDQATLRVPPQTMFVPAEGYVPESEDARFSGTEEDAIFARDVTTNRVLRYFIIGTGYSLAHGFAADLGAGEHIEQLSMSDDDQVIAVARATDAGPVGWMVYDGVARKTSTGLVDGLERVRLDRGGRYLFLTLKAASAAKTNARVVDLETGGETDLNGLAGQAAPRSFDLGSGLEVGYTPATNAIHRRDLATPGATAVLISSEQMVAIQHPVIEFSVGSAFALLAFQGAAHSVYGNELVAAFTDGSGRIARLANHRSPEEGADPHATLSPDGRFVAFTSPLRPGERRHVWLLIVPQLTP